MQKIQVTVEATVNDDGLLVLSSSAVIGNLDLGGSGAKLLPTQLTVRGNLHLQNTQIRMLPADLYVTGNLDLLGTEVSIINPGLIVGGDLTLGEETISLPKEMQVHGDLYLQHSPVRELKDGVTVRGRVHGL
ncbi:hypothetical protein AOQ73_18125 [Bradyrhizobium pachyrhizi]|nr:hypothetical protein AOQ73_18125 [Bradyrhizobium pachyrhizi]